MAGLGLIDCNSCERNFGEEDIKSAPLDQACNMSRQIVHGQFFPSHSSDRPPPPMNHCNALIRDLTKTLLCPHSSHGITRHCLTLRAAPPSHLVQLCQPCPVLGNNQKVHRRLANTASDAENKGENKGETAIEAGTEVGTEGETERGAEGRRGGARETGNAVAVDCIVEEEEEDEDDEDGQ